jgi:hypothetical protein
MIINGVIMISTLQHNTMKGFKINHNFKFDRAFVTAPGCTVMRKHQRKLVNPALSIEKSSAIVALHTKFSFFQKGQSSGFSFLNGCRQFPELVRGNIFNQNPSPW